LVLCCACVVGFYTRYCCCGKLAFVGFVGLGGRASCNMAIGQGKVFAQRTYGVTNGAADRTSPDRGK
jgi:hypothetical protein